MVHLIIIIVFLVVIIIGIGCGYKKCKYSKLQNILAENGIKKFKFDKKTTQDN